MGRQSNKGRKKTKKKISQTSKRNFVADAGTGCYIVREPNAGNIIEFENIDAAAYDGENVPDVALDPDDKTLSLCNVDRVSKVAYVTVYETECFGGDFERLQPGSTTDNNGETKSCLTFIVLCPPSMFVHLCYMQTDDVLSVRIESDVQEWNRHPAPDDSHPQQLGFPLAQGPFLCTQGENGHLTHFMSGNLHALDFRCPVGTPLLAAGDGVVIESRNENSLTGIAVSNLFKWNSILLKLDNDEDPLFVEYVHIQSSEVKVGQRVSMGEVIGTSGSVGFSPEPHLHFAAYRSGELDAATVRVLFRAQDHSSFLPNAGRYYAEEGEVSMETTG
jgi:murein DD-endopeptidase MepM/ murein hydrolase activator NlpD